jgi:hypothetical protein
MTSQYDTDLFEVSISEEFICSICKCVLKDPVQLKCEHLFCRGCITTFIQQSSKNTQFCPLDRKPAKVADIQPAHKSINNILSRLDVKCRNYKNGCKQKMKLEKFEEHEKTCQYDPCGSGLPKPEQTPEETSINVIVHMAEGKTIIINCKTTDTVLMFKKKIEEREGVKAEEQNIVHKTKVLVDDEELKFYNIQDKSAVFSTLRFNGGIDIFFYFPFL